MDYFVSCECGSRVSAVKQATPTVKRCSCGRELPIPAADKPAAAANKPAPPSAASPTQSGAKSKPADPRPNPQAAFDAVVRAVAERSLAIGDCCAVCGKPTTETLWFRIDRAGMRIVRKDEIHPIIRILGEFVGVSIGSGTSGAKRTPEFDLVTAVEVPLRIHAVHSSAVRKYKAAKLDELIRSVPLYARLLEAYPEAAVYPV